MKMKDLLLLLVLSMFGFLAKAQNPYAFVVDSLYNDSLYIPTFSASAKTLPAYEAKLNAAGTLLLRSRDPQLRSAASDTILNALQRALRMPKGNTYPWTGLESVMLQEPASRTWKIFTWQHFVNDSTYRYHGILQVKDDPQQLHVLQDNAQALGMEREYELRPDQWYGALYYGVQPFKTKKGKDAWVLFGYDADGYFHRRKVADVLTFSRSGVPLL